MDCACLLIISLLNAHAETETDSLVPCLDFSVNFTSYSETVESDNELFLVCFPHAEQCIGYLCKCLQPFPEADIGI